MAYQLRDGLSYCEAGQQAIFLDIECDRYFQLPEALTKLLVAHRQGMHTADIETLLRANIVVETRDTHDLLSPCPANLVGRSVLESSSDPERMATSFIPEVLAWICMTKWQLGRQRLGTVLRGLPRPQKGVPIVDPISGSDSNRRYFQAAIAFMRARRFVPIETNCLLDSLALMRFLSRRNLPAVLVFGVIPDPFSAHCWVQAGRLALNDSAGNINAHTPIRTVP